MILSAAEKQLIRIIRAARGAGPCHGDDRDDSPALREHFGFVKPDAGGLMCSFAPARSPHSPHPTIRRRTR